MVDKSLDPQELMNLPQEDLEDIVARVKAGAKNPKEALDFDDDSLNAIEGVALGLYRSEMYDKASLVYGFALRLDPDRATCWRGLGACAHASKSYDNAMLCYHEALQRDPKDLIAKAFLGECFCMVGRVVEGKALLRSFIESAKNDLTLKEYLARARAIVEEEEE